MTVEPVLVPAPVASALTTWVAVHDELAPGVVEGLYVVGSVALDDWTPHSDVDVIAVVADPSDPDLPGSLTAVHDALAGRLDVPVDGPYVAWGDLVVPPVGVSRPWVLDGEFHLDGESFELNPVVWYTLATHGVTLRGDPPADIGIPLDDHDRRSWVADNVASYWRGVGEELRVAVEADATMDAADGAVLEWVALGAARMLYTHETGDVTSKSGAGRWAMTLVPEFAEMLTSAVRVREVPGDATRAELIAAADFVEYVVAATGG